MRRILSLALFTLVIAVALPAHAAVIPAQVIATPSSDTLAQRIEKAANVVPSAVQLAWQKRELTSFIHFGPNTFNNVEWGTGTEDPDVVNPTNLDTDQWASTLKNTGFQEVIFTAKHHDGFLMYPSKYSNHTIKSSSWRNGQGDIVKNFADSARKYGLKIGFYLSPADLHESLAGGKYGNNSPARAVTIPEAGLDGTRPSGPATFNVVADDYNRFYMNTLYELLTQYGQVDEVWFDGANPLGNTTQTYDYSDWARIVHTLQPTAAMFGGIDTRWVGNENGVARTAEYSALPLQGSATGAENRPTNPPDESATDLGSDAQLGTGDFLKWLPAGCDARLEGGWFWHPGATPKSLAQLADMYHTSIGRNCPLLLDTPPDTTGLLPAADVTRLNEFAAWIGSVYGTDLARGSAASSTNGGTPANAVDSNYDTHWQPNTTVGSLTLDLGSPRTIGEVGVQENITVGQRVTSFAVDTWDGTNWTQAAAATTIGFRRLLKLSTTITTSRIRLRILSARANPAISGFSAYTDGRIANLAMGRPAGQSSTPSWGGVAGLAVDGNTSGNWADGSVTHTADPVTESNPWWRVDLGSSQALSNVKIWNRTDCCSNRLTNYWLFASDTPFDTAKTPTQQAATPGVWSSHQNTQAATPTVIDVNRPARYLMVQQAGPALLSLAEVEAFPAVTGLVDLARGRTATASSTETADFPAADAVDGNPGTRWSSLYTDPQWLRIDLGSTYQISQVKLTWENAYGRSYQIQVSSDGTNFTTIYATTTGDGGTDNLTGLTGAGRYLRVYGTARGTQWGYSLWSIEAYS